MSTDKIINILLAEDDKNIALAIKTIVSRDVPGSKLTIVVDGAEAWKKLQENSFDLVISDWNMPTKGGDELLYDIRKDKRFKKLPFLMVTARADKDSVITAIQAGATGYISKPFEKEELVQKITALLAKT